MMMKIDTRLASVIDHTALKPDVTPDEIKRLCEEAMEYGFCSVCVNSCYTAVAHDILKNSSVKVCTVVGFPLGAMSTEAKAFEAQKAKNDGSDEIDMVINVGWLKAGLTNDVLNDINMVAKAAKGCILKVIIETCLLTNEEIVNACKIINRSDADFAKTSTGFSSGGATVDDVRLMRSVLHTEIKIKAAGGISDSNTANAMLVAGADRIGASKSIKICCTE